MFRWANSLFSDAWKTVLKKKNALSVLHCVQPKKRVQSFSPSFMAKHITDPLQGLTLWPLHWSSLCPCTAHVGPHSFSRSKQLQENETFLPSLATFCLLLLRLCKEKIFKLLDRLTFGVDSKKPEWVCESKPAPVEVKSHPLTDRPSCFHVQMSLESSRVQPSARSSGCWVAA